MRCAHNSCEGSCACTRVQRRGGIDWEKARCIEGGAPSESSPPRFRSGCLRCSACQRFFTALSVLQGVVEDGQEDSAASLAWGLLHAQAGGGLARQSGPGGQRQAGCAVPAAAALARRGLAATRKPPPDPHLSPNILLISVQRLPSWRWASISTASSCSDRAFAATHVWAQRQAREWGGVGWGLGRRAPIQQPRPRQAALRCFP